MADDRSLSELLWDYTVYAPIGLVITVAEDLPMLSEKGRARLAGHIQIARVVGKFAVRDAQRRAGRMFGAGSHPTQAPPTDASSDAQAPPRSAPRVQRPPRPPSGAARDSSPQPRSSTDRSSGSGRTGAHTITVAHEASPARPAAGTSSGPAVASLAIPGYDTLAASQVVQRLSSLRPDELDAIRSYEIANRGRRTILHRIAQLAADR